MKTLEEWEVHIRRKWMESVGYTSPEAYSTLTDDMGAYFFKAVHKYRLAKEATDKKKKKARLLQSAEAAGEYIRMSLERENIDNIRNLHLVMDKIKNGSRSKLDGHAKSIVGFALMNFLLDKDRLPTDRKELCKYADLNSVTPRNLSDALVYYSLNKEIRDKTGPKSAK